MIVSLVNSLTNATRIGWHLWEIDLRFTPGLPPGKVVNTLDRGHARPFAGGFKRHFCEDLSTSGDKCPQNGSKNEATAPRTGLGCSREGPRAEPRLEGRTRHANCEDTKHRSSPQNQSVLPSHQPIHTPRRSAAPRHDRLVQKSMNLRYEPSSEPLHNSAT